MKQITQVLAVVSWVFLVLGALSLTYCVVSFLRSGGVSKEESLALLEPTWFVTVVLFSISLVTDRISNRIIMKVINEG
jgi:hypothetical protein